MSNETNISQTTGGMFGKTTQIATQNNYYNQGLTPQQAAQESINLFMEYYPKLKEELFERLKKCLLEELNQFNPNLIIPPKPKILIPVLENASITEEDNLRRIYAKLLANSMNKEKAEDVHPSFISVINQLTSLEAQIINIIKQINEPIRVATIGFNANNSMHMSQCFWHYFSPFFDSLNNNDDVSVGLENLSRLGIIDINSNIWQDFEFEEHIKQHPVIKNRFDVEKQKYGNISIRIYTSVLQLSDFGERMTNVCISE